MQWPLLIQNCMTAGKRNTAGTCGRHNENVVHIMPLCASMCWTTGASTPNVIGGRNIQICGQQRRTQVPTCGAIECSLAPNF